MTPLAVLDVLPWLIVGPLAGTFHVWLCRKLIPAGGFRVVGYVIAAISNATFALLVGLPPAMGNGIAAAICAYAAWREWRRTRRRRPSRLLGRVRDLGHRLTVVPEPSLA